MAMRRSLFALLLLVISLSPFSARAQAPAPAAPAPAPSSDQLLKPEQLDALVAPIALYPDDLLSLVLMASTYPLEVVQADRWASQNKNLKGDQLKAEVDKQGWDGSVKSLVATPDVLTMMSSKLDWTQKLGDAVLAQQPDVMDAIQRLRARAQANNKLNTTPQQTVAVTQASNGHKVITIQSASADTVYVPYYDPNVVYGGWPYSEYPPYYWGYPSYIGAGLVATGVAFGAGYLVGRWGSGNWNWGGGVNWGAGNIISNRPRVNALNVNNINTGNIWQHNPQHRQGVRYSNNNVQQRFGNNNRAGADNRMDFRGRNGNQVLNPGNNNGNRAGQRPTQQPAANRDNRQNAGNRQGANNNRQNADRSAKNTKNNRPAQTSRNNNASRNNARSNVNRSNAMNVQRGNVARAQSTRGHASVGNARASVGMGGGGGARVGGGAPRGGGGGVRGGGGGRRSDIRLKHDIVLLGHLADGLGFYRFSYIGSDTRYVGVMAQEVQGVMPDAVTRGRDGYLRVFYDKLGLRFETYDAWVAEGAQVPSVRVH